MIRIDVFCEEINLPYKNIGKNKIKTVASTAAEMLELKDASITIVMTSDRYIRKINNEFRGHDEPTDVISFSNRDNPFPAVDDTSEEIGDIYISIDRADRQSQEYRVTLQDELKRLIVHGILHLVGYDHERSDEDEEIMLRKEEEICRCINL
jgi:rRNA maturation RNase YbeY